MERLDIPLSLLTCENGLLYAAWIKLSHVPLNNVLKTFNMKEHWSLSKIYLNSLGNHVTLVLDSISLKCCLICIWWTNLHQWYEINPNIVCGFLIYDLDFICPFLVSYLAIEGSLCLLLICIIGVSSLFFILWFSPYSLLNLFCV